MKKDFKMHLVKIEFLIKTDYFLLYFLKYISFFQNIYLLKIDIRKNIYIYN